MKALYKLMIVALTGMAAVMLSCNKDNYFKDGGLHNPVTPLSTYDYLKNHPYHYFDTTVLLIDHFNLKDSVNRAGTFFAFTDFSVNALMKALTVTSLDGLYDSVSSKLLTQYMFSDTAITVANAQLTAVEYPNWASDTTRTFIKKIQSSYGVNLSSSAPTYNYYVLQFIFINGNVDGPGGPTGSDPIDQITPCQTTGIQTASGTTLHVLANTAVLRKQ